jgi:hypothetical protein
MLLDLILGLCESECCRAPSPEPLACPLSEAGELSWSASPPQPPIKSDTITVVIRRAVCVPRIGGLCIASSPRDGGMNQHDGGPEISTGATHLLKLKRDVISAA